MFTWESCTFGVRPQLKTKEHAKLLPPKDTLKMH